jgi:hypothetical protein
MIVWNALSPQLMTTALCQHRSVSQMSALVALVINNVKMPMQRLLSATRTPASATSALTMTIVKMTLNLSVIASFVNLIALVMINA